MELTDLEKRIETLESSVSNLMGPNPAFEEWLKHIRGYEDRVNNVLENWERRVAELENPRPASIFDKVT